MGRGINEVRSLYLKHVVLTHFTDSVVSVYVLQVSCFWKPVQKRKCAQLKPFQGHFSEYEVFLCVHTQRENSALFMWMSSWCR